jgi:hypothetical protein
VCGRRLDKDLAGDGPAERSCGRPVADFQTQLWQLVSYMPKSDLGIHPIANHMLEILGHPETRTVIK